MSEFTPEVSTEFTDFVPDKFSIPGRYAYPGVDLDYIPLTEERLQDPDVREDYLRVYEAAYEDVIQGVHHVHISMRDASAGFGQAVHDAFADAQAHGLIEADVSPPQPVGDAYTIETQPTRVWLAGVEQSVQENKRRFWRK